jgi:hypothetical protein
MTVFLSHTLQNNYNAFAVTYTTVTTTGTQTNDNCIIGEGGTDSTTLNDRVFMICSSTISSSGTLAVYDMNGTQLATVSSGISNPSLGTYLLPLYASSDTNSILVANGEDGVFQKYHYNGVSLSLVGTFTPSCTYNGNKPEYDSFGFVWFTCSTATDKVGAFNPSTMTSKYLSNGLSALSPACDSPVSISIDRQTSLVTSFYLFITCDTTNSIFIGTVSNSGFTYTSVTSLASSFARAESTQDSIYVDETNNRLVATGTGIAIATWTYTGNGLANPTVTSEYATIGSAVSQICAGNLNQISTGNNTLFCAGTNTVQGFLSTSSDFINVINTGEFSTTFLASFGMVSTTVANEYLVSNGQLNGGTQKFFLIGGTTEIGGNPTPPPTEGCTSNCSLPDCTANCSLPNCTTNCSLPACTTNCSLPVCTSNCSLPVCVSGCSLPACQSNCTSSQFCSIPANQGLLRCRLETTTGNQCISHNNPYLNQSASNFTNPFNPIANTNCLIVGAANLPNDDIKTNGVGYLFLGITLLLFNILFFIGVIAANNRGVVIGSPIYISALISMSIIAAFTLFQWTDPLILIISVVALIALATPKIIGIIRGGGMTQNAE